MLDKKEERQRRKRLQKEREAFPYPAFSGVSVACLECMQALGYTSPALFVEDCKAGKAEDGIGFSSCSCGLCGDTLAGDRHLWHYSLSGSLDSMEHGEDLCVDCLLYINGALEEEEE